MPITLGKGSIYTEQGTMVPAFSSDKDAETWRSLIGKKFDSLTITLDEDEELAHKLIKIIDKFASETTRGNIIEEIKHELVKRRRR